MKRLNYFVCSFLLWCCAVFAPLICAAADGTDSTRVTGVNGKIPFYRYSQAFKNDYNNATNGVTVNGVDTRNSSQNPTTNGCANHYTVKLSDGNSSFTAPYTANYTFDSHFQFYQNQGGNVTVTMVVYVNGQQVSSGNIVLSGGNGYIREYEMGPFTLSLTKGDVISLQIYNGPCSQAYILLGGSVLLVTQ